MYRQNKSDNFTPRKGPTEDPITFWIGFGPGRNNFRCYYSPILVHAPSIFPVLGGQTMCIILCRDSFLCPANCLNGQHTLNAKGWFHAVRHCLQLQLAIEQFQCNLYYHQRRKSKTETDLSRDATFISKVRLYTNFK